MSVAMAAAVAAEAAKPQTFEEAAASARTVGDLQELFGPLFAECKSDDELEERQCAAVRDWLIAQRVGGTFVAFGDESALTFAPYDSSEKKIELEVSGCLACGRPLKLDGDDRPRFVTTRVPKAIKAGRAIGLEVGFDDVPLPDEKAAAAWLKQMSHRLRVQFVFRLGPMWKSGTGDKVYEGVTFVPVAHRVVDRCTGKVIASDPPSSGDAQAMPDDRCPVVLTEAQKRAQEEAGLPDQLSTIDINHTMAKMRGKVHDCYKEFDVTGTVLVRMVVEKSGQIADIHVLPPFAQTGVGYCLRNAIQTLRLPRFKGQKMLITYPFQLR